jgi:hypothetical protein
VLFNIGLSLLVRNEIIPGMESLRKAQDLVVKSSFPCTYISQALQLGVIAPNEIFPVEAPEILWNPRKADIENLVKLKFLGKSHLVMSDSDSFIGFSGRKVKVCSSLYKENTFGKDYRQRAILERRREVPKLVTFTYTPPTLSNATLLRSPPSLKRSNTLKARNRAQKADLNRSNSAPSSIYDQKRIPKLGKAEIPIRKESKGYRFDQKLAHELNEQKSMISLEIIIAGKPNISLVTEKTAHLYYIMDMIKSKLEINDSEVCLKYTEKKSPVLVVNNQDFANAISNGISSFYLIRQNKLR